MTRLSWDRGPTVGEKRPSKARDGRSSLGSVGKRSRFRWVVGVAAAVLGPGLASCYTTGQGSDPPLDQLYFPVGLAVSHGGSVLYSLNSDFDLQYNGGTIQSLDLRAIRRDTVLTIERPFHPALPLVRATERPAGAENLACSALNLSGTRLDGTARPLGESCAPPMRTEFYVRDKAIVGAFGTDLQISRPRPSLAPPDGTAPKLLGRQTERLFAPLRGSAAVLWVDVPNDARQGAAAESAFTLDCGRGADNRCAADHLTGPNPELDPTNTRAITLPGEPFGIAQSEDGSSLVVTHQSDTKVSLLSTGLPYACEGGTAAPCQKPSVQFVVEGARTGGTAVVAVPYDRDAFTSLTLPKPAYLTTSRVVAELGLFREYDDGSGGVASTLRRPFLARERAYPLTVAAAGTDSRGLAIDSTARISCKARVLPANPSAVPPRTAADVAADKLACARKPVRVYIANRTPASLLVADLGSDVGTFKDEAFDPEALNFFDTIPLTAGPSKVFLAPIVDARGNYALRIFVVCFDASSIFVIDPETRELENTIRVEAGPYALAFDPFDPNDAALRGPVAKEAVEVLPNPDGSPSLSPELATVHKYRFAYVASFTKSTVQVIDLDNSLPKKDTFEKVVFTLGEPTLPKGVK